MVRVNEVDVIRGPANDKYHHHQSKHLDQLLLVLPDPDGGRPGDDHLCLSLFLIP